MDKVREALKGVARELAGKIGPSTTLGLGSGSTVASLLEELTPLVFAKSKTVTGVPTSSQIEIVASRCGVNLVPFRGSVDIVIDGADQVDKKLNLVKGGGGALLKEKVIMASAKQIVVLASEQKFAAKLCEKNVMVPIEVYPMARESVKLKLSELGGVPSERLLPKEYPYFTENGNIILDTKFDPLDEPHQLEVQVKSTPGVAEVGIFTIKPITVYKLRVDGTFQLLNSDD